MARVFHSARAQRDTKHTNNRRSEAWKPESLES